LTAKQDGELLRERKVGKLILTHISQRYENNLRDFLNDAKTVFKNTVIAEDFSEFEI